MSVLALKFLGLNPDRKELGSQVSRFGLGKIEVALVSGRRIRHVEVVVKKALGGVGVSIDYQRRVMNLCRGLSFHRPFCRFRLSHKKRNGQEAYHRAQHDPWQHRRECVLDRKVKGRQNAAFWKFYMNGDGG